MEPTGPIAILNQAVITDIETQGAYRVLPMTVEEARWYLDEYGYVSYVGHESAAHWLTEQLGRDIPMNRQMYQQKPGEFAILAKLQSGADRVPEGKILTDSEINEMGFKLALLIRYRLASYD